MNEEKKLNEKELNEKELDQVAGGIGSLETLYNWLEPRGYITEGLRLAKEAKEKGGNARKTFVTYIFEVIDTKAPDSIKWIKMYTNALYDTIAPYDIL